MLLADSRTSFVNLVGEVVYSRGSLLGVIRMDGARFRFNMSRVTPGVCNRAGPAIPIRSAERAPLRRVN